MNRTQVKEYSFDTGKALAKLYPDASKEWLIQKAIYDFWEMNEGLIPFAKTTTGKLINISKKNLKESLLLARSGDDKPNHMFFGRLNLNNQVVFFEDPKEEITKANLGDTKDERNRSK